MIVSRTETFLIDCLHLCMGCLYIYGWI